MNIILAALFTVCLAGITNGDLTQQDDSKKEVTLETIAGEVHVEEQAPVDNLEKLEHEKKSKGIASGEYEESSKIGSPTIEKILNSSTDAVEAAKKKDFKGEKIFYDLYQSVLADFGLAIKSDISADTLKLLSDGFGKFYVLIRQMKFPDESNLSNPYLIQLLAYLSKVLKTNLLPYYATQPFCVATKSYYEPVNPIFYEECDIEYHQLRESYLIDEEIRSYVISSETQKLMIDGVVAATKLLFSYFEKIDAKAVAGSIAEKVNLENLVVERFVSFFPITLYAITTVLSSDVPADLIAEGVCTHMGYSQYVDTKLLPASTGEQFWKQIKSLKAYSGTSTSSVALTLIISLSAYALMQ